MTHRGLHLTGGSGTHDCSIRKSSDVAQSLPLRGGIPRCLAGVGVCRQKGMCFETIVERERIILDQELNDEVTNGLKTAETFRSVYKCSPVTGTLKQGNACVVLVRCPCQINPNKPLPCRIPLSPCRVTRLLDRIATDTQNGGMPTDARILRDCPRR